MKRVPSSFNCFHQKPVAGYKQLLGILLCLLLANIAGAAPVVTASIRPLQLIAAAITDGLDSPGLVFAQEQDPHHAALRPSSRRMLADADVVLWIGPTLELPLVNILAEHPGRLLTVQALDGIVLHTEHGRTDPHVWLDTVNARTIAAALVQTLSALDPGNAARYAANQTVFARALDALDADIARNLATAGSRHWAVYHHAFRYFERQFALQAPMTLADDENNPPGMRSIMALRAALQQNRLACLLVEPGISENTIKGILGTGELPVIPVDVMGSGLEPGPDAYVQLMRNLGDALAHCLQEQP